MSGSASIRSRAMYSPFFYLALYVAAPSTMFVTGSGLVLLGTFFRWRFTSALVRAEEHAKEGLLSEEQARRRIAIARYSGPAMILLGITVFALVLWA